MSDDTVMRMQNGEDTARLRALRDERNLAIADLLDIDPPLVTSVLVNLAECETLLEWVRHIETYNLGYTGGLSDKLQRARRRLQERSR